MRISCNHFLDAPLESVEDIATQIVDEFINCLCAALGQNQNPEEEEELNLGMTQIEEILYNQCRYYNDVYIKERYEEGEFRLHSHFHTTDFEGTSKNVC